MTLMMGRRIRTGTARLVRSTVHSTDMQSIGRHILTMNDSYRGGFCIDRRVERWKRRGYEFASLLMNGVLSVAAGKKSKRQVPLHSLRIRRNKLPKKHSGSEWLCPRMGGIDPWLCAFPEQCIELRLPGCVFHGPASSKPVRRVWLPGDY